MQITVDFDMCAATGGCVNQAPEVFEIRDDGFLYVLQESPDESLRASKTCRRLVPYWRHHHQRLTRTSTRGLHFQTQICMGHK